MLIHIPQSSVKLIDSFAITSDDINHVTDLFTDELFFWAGAEKMIFPLSRLVCDVERLIDDPLEKDGYGIHTTKTDSGIVYRDNTDYDRVMSLYNRWHKLLAKKVLDHSHYTDKVILIDAHSFGVEQLDSNYSNAIPDICIGSNQETPRLLVDLTISEFQKLGYRISENIPFVGSIRVTGAESIMIEVNKKLYLDKNYQKSSNFSKLSDDIERVLNRVGEYEITGA